jgi:hypothetical protein
MQLHQASAAALKQHRVVNAMRNCAFFVLHSSTRLPVALVVSLYVAMVYFATVLRAVAAPAACRVVIGQCCWLCHTYAVVQH